MFEELSNFSEVIQRTVVGIRVCTQTNIPSRTHSLSIKMCKWLVTSTRGLNPGEKVVKTWRSAQKVDPPPSLVPSTTLSCRYVPRGIKKLKLKEIKSKRGWKYSSLDQSTLLLIAIRAPNQFLHPQACMKEAEINPIKLSMRYYLVHFNLSIYNIIIMYSV